MIDDLTARLSKMEGEHDLYADLLRDLKVKGFFKGKTS